MFFPALQSSFCPFTGFGLGASSAEEPDPIEGRVVEGGVASAGFTISQNNFSVKREERIVVLTSGSQRLVDSDPQNRIKQN